MGECYMLFFFFFQAEDGIRDYKVTGVQTCALPISTWRRARSLATCGACTRPGRGGGPHGGSSSVSRGCWAPRDRKSTRLNSSHLVISYAVFCLKKKKYTLSAHTFAERHLPAPLATAVS